MVQGESSNHDPGGGGRGDESWRFEPYSRDQPRVGQEGANRGRGGGQRRPFWRGRGGYRGGFGSRGGYQSSQALVPFGGNMVDRPQGSSLPWVSEVAPTFVQNQRGRIIGADFVNVSPGGGPQERFAGPVNSMGMNGVIGARISDTRDGTEVLEKAKAIKGGDCDLGMLVWGIDRVKHAQLRREQGNRVVRIGEAGTMVGVRGSVAAPRSEISLLDVPEDNGEDDEDEDEDEDEEMEEAPKTQVEVAATPKQIAQAERAAAEEKAIREAEERLEQARAARAATEAAETAEREKREKQAAAAEMRQRAKALLDGANEMIASISGDAPRVPTAPRPAAGPSTGASLPLRSRNVRGSSVRGSSVRGSSVRGKTFADALADPAPPFQQQTRPANRVKCGGCGSSTHTLMHCFKVEKGGKLSGCPLHNTTGHSLDDCKMWGRYSLRQKVDVALYQRANMPPLRFRGGWFEISFDYFNANPGHRPPKMLPWTMEYTKANKGKLKSFQERWDNSNGDRRVLPQDPATKSWIAAKFAFGRGPAPQDNRQAANSGAAPAAPETAATPETRLDTALDTIVGEGSKEVQLGSVNMGEFESDSAFKVDRYTAPEESQIQPENVPIPGDMDDLRSEASLGSDAYDDPKSSQAQPEEQPINMGEFESDSAFFVDSYEAPETPKAPRTSKVDGDSISYDSDEDFIATPRTKARYTQMDDEISMLNEEQDDEADDVAKSDDGSHL